MIEIRNLEKRYDTQGQVVHALKNINLTINEGEIFGIIGLSGAGKSTLVRCINMLEKPTSGQIFVSGQEITKLRPSALRKARQNIGMIFQHFNLLWSRTVAENIAFAMEIAGIKDRTKIAKRVDELLKLVDLMDKKNVFPAQLSGGQKQRVAIARALANEPQVLLCDEATSALDPQTTESILDLLLDINKKLKLTMIVITHEMAVIKKICDSVAVIEGGNIVEQGSVLNIFTTPQAETSRKFMKTIINKEIPQGILQKHQGKDNSLLLNITFVDGPASEPIISELSKKFDLTANILYGSIDHIKNEVFGNLTVILKGDAGNLRASLQHLQNLNLKVEVLPYD